MRAYLTGFSDQALEAFAAVQPGARSVYRCPVHCALGELPEVLATIEPQGRLYSTLCEFQTQELMPEGEMPRPLSGLWVRPEGFNSRSGSTAPSCRGTHGRMVGATGQDAGGVCAALPSDVVRQLNRAPHLLAAGLAGQPF